MKLVSNFIIFMIIHEKEIFKNNFNILLQISLHFIQFYLRNEQ